MSRYYLDTNMLVFIINGQMDDVCRDVRAILTDSATLLYASSIAVQELLFLHRIGKVEFKWYKTDEAVFNSLARHDIEMVYFNEHHFAAYKSLAVHPGHKDMNDHAIIAQSVADRIAVISSDHTFREYAPQGLRFVHNRR